MPVFALPAVALAAVIASVLPTIPAGADTAIDTSLTQSIRTAMSTSTAHAWTVVIDVAGRGRVVDVSGTYAMLPASTQKLFTTLPVLLREPNARFSTSFAATKGPSLGVLHADLVVHSSGDPTLMAADLNRLAQRVHNAGVRKVVGRLVVDIGSLPTVRVRTGWKSTYIPDDIPPLSPFPVSGDRLSTSSLYLSNPTAANIAYLRGRLKANGVGITGASIVARHVSTPRVFTSHSSATFASLVRTTLLVSQNFYAEQFFSAFGAAAVSQTASAAGASADTTTDGSGLSLRDHVTSEAEVALLEYAANSPAADALRGSLPVACRTGTLQHDLCASSTAGMVVAKTGSLDGVKTLAGYTTDGLGRAVTFAILTNSDRNTDAAMASMQKVLTVVRGYTG